MKENEELVNILSEINGMKEKISKLEKENIDINKKLSEIKEKEKNNEIFTKEINNLKKRQDQFESSTLSNLSNFKNEIINDLNEKHIEILENLKSNKNENNNIENCDINLDDIQNNNENDIKNFRKKGNNNCLKHNYSRDSIKSALLAQKEFLTFQKNNDDENLNELTKNQIKISLLENKYNNLSNQYMKDIKNIKDILETLTNYQKNYENFKDNTILSLKNFKNENQLFTNQISNLIEDFQNKLYFFEKNNIQIKSKISERNNDIDIILKNVNQTLNDEMNEFRIEMNKQVTEQNKEIENFEKFISQEHSKFVDFIQNRLDESISSIKKLFDFNVDDIKKLNEKIEIIQEIIKKVRIDVFQSINDSEEFMENKYQSLFRLINKE
jgi:hypothetical protein